MFFFYVLTLLFQNAKANDGLKIVQKVIYGADDRMDVFESSDSLMKEISRSTAAQIYKRYIVKNVDENNITSYILKFNTLHDFGMCQSERFSNQSKAASCSGFLIASDILVTAGHCVETAHDCLDHSWVFDYSNIEEENKSFTFHEDQIYHCTQVISHKKDEVMMNDYSILKLDRPVVGRMPLKFRTMGKATNNAIFTIIGHPSGLPTKITSNAFMRDNTNSVFFVTNADSYSGNSGSAVVDSRTGIVEGLLVRGDTDYEKLADGCYRSIKRDQNGGRGEDVTRITTIDF
jgi:V8-like Glu-specific endopeptidase